MIGFLHPWALVGLLAAGIPILLHLLARREPPTVVFPAVRYLITTTREHQRRLKLQNLLLLLVRTLLIVALVLAAAGPTAPVRGVPGHAPSALVLIVDNSPSSGAVVGGSPRLAQLREAARRVVARSTPDDALWLLTADGVPQRGDPRTLTSQLDALEISPRRLDLGSAVILARDVLGTDQRPGEIVLLSDLQASAVSPADPGVPLLVGRPDAPPPPNVGIARMETGAQPWSGEGGRVSLALDGDSGLAVALTARLGSRPPRQALGRAGSAVTLQLPGAPSGWWTLVAELAPDELRADDQRTGVVRIAPVARVRWDTASRHVAAACEVLAANRRIERGDEVTFGRLGRGSSVVQPPDDAAQLGALNRALGARGVGWSYGPLSIEPATTDSGAIVGRVRVTRRYALQPTGSGRTGVLATVAGEPWIVRSGEVVLLGSRLEPEWTELPVRAGFMPFMDLLLNRLARGEALIAQGAPGDALPLPDLATGVRQGEREWQVEGGGSFRPTDVGAYYLVADADTLGAISANLDPRESLLAPAPDDRIERLWTGARVTSLEESAELVFAAGAMADFRGPLLLAALLLGLGELALASALRRQQ
ncbi:MAG TPA: BatA and WFA domain-containing protein [Gemmatimonadales bacterium]|nr:BatA and WFA domain-containing protein [Gemmatimonadales bacterium]